MLAAHFCCGRKQQQMTTKTKTKTGAVFFLGFMTLKNRAGATQPASAPAASASPSRSPYKPGMRSLAAAGSPRLASLRRRRRRRRLLATPLREEVNSPAATCAEGNEEKMPQVNGTTTRAMYEYGPQATSAVALSLAEVGTEAASECELGKTEEGSRRPAAGGRRTGAVR